MSGSKKTTGRQYFTETVNSLKSMAVIGANGMLGSDLEDFLSGGFQVTGINRGNYDHFFGKKFDVVINANGNSKRFWANAHPYDDFKLSTESVYKSIFDFPTDLYIYISSSDVYEKHNSPKFTDERQSIDPNKLQPYGFNKFLSEIIVKRYTKNYLILRSCLILGRKLKKGPFFDIKTRHPLFITSSSRLQIITTKEISFIIKKLINKKIKNDIYNVGGNGTFSLGKVNKYFKEKVSYRPQAQKQVYEMKISKLEKIFPLKSSNLYLEEYLHGLT